MFRRVLTIADALVAICAAVWAWFSLMSHAYNYSGSWHELEWTPFWWLMGLAALAAVNGVYVVGHVVPKRLRESRLGRMAGLWVDAKEIELKRRARPTEPE